MPGRSNADRPWLTEQGMVSHDIRGQAAEQALCLIFHARGKIKRVGTPPVAAIAGGNGPQIPDRDRLSVRAVKLALELIVIEVESINRAVTEISDQQITSQVAKTIGRDRQPPR